jgi:hypothetical protein
MGKIIGTVSAYTMDAIPPHDRYTTFSQDLACIHSRAAASIGPEQLMFIDAAQGVVQLVVQISFVDRCHRRRNAALPQPWRHGKASTMNQRTNRAGAATPSSTSTATKSHGAHHCAYLRR